MQHPTSPYNRTGGEALPSYVIQPGHDAWVVGDEPWVTVDFSQAMADYQAELRRAPDAWHLWSRWQPKLLSHTLAVHLCQQTGLGSLRFADLLTT